MPSKTGQFIVLWILLEIRDILIDNEIRIFVWNYLRRETLIVVALHTIIFSKFFIRFHFILFLSSNENETAAARVAYTAQSSEENTEDHITINDAQKVYRPTTSGPPIQSKEERGKSMRQVVAAFIVNLGTINTGLVFGFSAVAIPQLKQADSLIHIDDSQSSWIGKWIISISHNIHSMIACDKQKLSHITPMNDDRPMRPIALLIRQWSNFPRNVTHKQ